jgi:hypothetical protein
MAQPVELFIAGLARELARAVVVVDRAAERKPDVETLTMAARHVVGRAV